jgi:DNA-binding NtrC family response regulator
MVRSFAAALNDLPDTPAESAREDVLGMVDDSGEVRSLARVEEEMIRFAIRHYDGQMSEVARRLGIGRSTLYRKLKEFGIDSARRDDERLVS